MVGVVQRRQGNWQASLASLRRAVELDPKFANGWSVLVALLQRGRRFDEAIAAQRRVVELQPNVLSSSYVLAELHFFARGSVREMEQWFAGLTAQQANTPEAIDLKRRWFGAPEEPADTVRAERASVLRRRLGNEPDNDGLWSQLAEVEIGRGKAEEALQAARRAMELMPESQDAWTGPEHAAVYAFVCSRAGDRDRAIAEYARLLRRPGPLNVHEMKRRGRYEPLRDDPRFQALLNDPKNNEPLF
jgi:tetratricopeptide (TPR) repeat protein